MALGTAYRSVQERIAGSPPDTRIVSHQWLATTIIQPGIHAALGDLAGDILDVGCGDKPYERHVPRATSYYGIDVYPRTKVDAGLADAVRGREHRSDLRGSPRPQGSLLAACWSSQPSGVQ